MERYEGKREPLEGRIREKTGASREAVREKVDSSSYDTEYSF